VPEGISIQLLIGGRKLGVGMSRKLLYLIDRSRKDKRLRGPIGRNEQFCEQDTLQFRISVVEKEPSIQLNYDLAIPRRKLAHGGTLVE
jgi:hypothetical protein